LPECNVKVLGHRADYWWPEARLVVETDGWAAHGTRVRFETDREHDAPDERLGVRGKEEADAVGERPQGGR
jgi:very-short-patch-repair endonuclease